MSFRMIALVAILALPTCSARAADCQNKDYSPYSEDHACVNKYYEVMEIAHNLGRVLYYEEKCGLQYEPTAVARYIREHTPNDRFDFSGWVNTAASYERTMEKTFDKGSVSPNTLLAVCTSIQMAAKHYGFVK